MTAPAAQWQLDRLSIGAREAAEIASLGAGVSLSSWLTRLIGETCAAEGVAPPSEPPKILEFTREIRDRVPSTPPRAPTAPIPANNFAPHTIPSAPPSAPAIEPTPVAPPQSAPTPLIFRPASIPAPAPAANKPIPAPATIVAVIPSSWPAGANMLPVAAIGPANLGTRRGEDIPEPLLADIATRGVRQPITVRRAAGRPDRYEIICGHRRWRAAQRVGFGHVPAILVTQEDAEAILASLNENLQIGNLSAVDEAQAYLRLLTQCAVDASVVTAAIGRDRKHVVQSMRLLGLPPLVRHLISAGMLSREHAYLLLDAPHPEALADAILAESLTVEAARQRLGAGAENKP
jgi:ParB family chromosome partitioning protein